MIAEITVKVSNRYKVPIYLYRIHISFAILCYSLSDMLRISLFPLASTDERKGTIDMWFYILKFMSLFGRAGGVPNR